MRKLYLLHALLVLGVLNMNAQSPLVKIAGSYFRSNPYKTEFSVFLEHLMNDPNLVEKMMLKKTDTSLFYFRGTYSSFNPFFFKPERVQILLTEKRVELDSSKADTIYFYQLMAYVKNTKNGQSDIKYEFDKIFKKYKGGFSSTSYAENPDGNMKNATYNFTERLCAVAPFALSWAGPNRNDELVLILTLRLGIDQNVATLPVPLYTF